MKQSSKSAVNGIVSMETVAVPSNNYYLLGAAFQHSVPKMKGKIVKCMKRLKNKPHESMCVFFQFDF